MLIAMISAKQRQNIVPTCGMMLGDQRTFNSIQFNSVYSATHSAKHFHYHTIELTIVCALERDTLEVVKLVVVCAPIVV